MTAAAKRWKYLRRLFRVQQMDFEFALWQMLYLFISPQKVFRDFSYRKQTKLQYARDDPAFLVLLAIWILISSIVFSVTIHFSFGEFLLFLLYVICIDYIGTGLVIGTLLWYLSNKYLRKSTCNDQDVEWGYAFDVHLNAFFPLLIILHLLQIIFYHIFYVEGGGSYLYFDMVLGNTLWLIAIGYYIYITFLGYSALPILKNTKYILVPMTVLFLIYIVSIMTRWNITVTVLTFYTKRI